MCVFIHVPMNEGPATPRRDRSRLALSSLPEVLHFLTIRYLFCLPMSVFTSFCADVLVLYSAPGVNIRTLHMRLHFLGDFFVYQG